MREVLVYCCEQTETHVSQAKKCDMIQKCDMIKCCFARLYNRNFGKNANEIRYIKIRKFPIDLLIDLTMQKYPADYFEVNLTVRLLKYWIIIKT